jgi:hypothetical protein
LFSSNYKINPQSKALLLTKIIIKIDFSYNLMTPKSSLSIVTLSLIALLTLASAFDLTPSQSINVPNPYQPRLQMSLPMTVKQPQSTSTLTTLRFP